ncbi:MAG: hypothetical protein SGI88_19155 [Candidatus Hydrogenedentes bacterium]|nr:hypothetical protein [Candidatus Hydrogenedentota bacterium]
MKHVRKISKATPMSAWWFGWFTGVGELKSGGAASAKALYVNALFNTLGTLDPRDV